MIGVFGPKPETEKTLAELRIEAATLTENAAHVEDELRAVLKTLQERQGRAEDSGKT